MNFLKASGTISEKSKKFKGDSCYTRSDNEDEDEDDYSVFAMNELNE